MKYTFINEELEIDGKLYVNGVGNYTGELNLDSTTSDVATYLPNMINVTYDDIVSLRDSSKLVPGQQYRITDYITVANQVDIATDGRRFDIIVTADDESTLNENARAIHHEGCDDFKDENLAAWELKYTLTNNGLYNWGGNWDTVEGDYHYDTVSDKKVTIDDVEYYRLNNTIDFLVKSNYETDRTIYEFQEQMITQFTITEIVNNDTIKCEEYDGHNYNYFNLTVDKTKIYNFPTLGDFYKIQDYADTYYIKYPYAVGDSVFGYYTNLWEAMGIVEIKPFVKSKGVIYYMKDEFNNECPYDFKTIKFYEDGIYIYTFDDKCYGNIIKPYMLHNKYELNFITLGYNCRYNTFGKNCYNNTFGYSCSNNTLGNNCYGNRFGNNCTYNTFGNYCYYNTFGNYCYYNTFGNYCYYITFGPPGDIRSYYRYIMIDNGNRDIYLNCTATTSSNKYYQNVRIGLGVNNKYTSKTITDSNVNQEFETYYRSKNYKTVDI